MSKYVKYRAGTSRYYRPRSRSRASRRPWFLAIIVLLIVSGAVSVFSGELQSGFAALSIGHMGVKLCGMWYWPSSRFCL